MKHTYFKTTTIVGLSMTALAVSLPTAAHAATTAPSIQSVGGDRVESHVHNEDDGSKTHYGSAFFHDAQPEVVARVDAAAPTGRLEVRDVRSHELICSSDVPAVGGLKRCTPTAPLAFGSITELEATVVTSGTTSSPSDRVAAQRLLDDPTIALGTFDPAAGTATVSGSASPGVPFFVSAGGRELTRGTTGDDGSWSADVTGVRSGDTIVVRTAVGSSAAAANVRLPDAGIGAIDAPVVRDLAVGADGTLSGVARITTRGQVQVLDAKGTPVTSPSGTSNPAGGDVRFAVTRAVAGATYTVVLTDRGSTAQTTFVAPGASGTTDPGVGSGSGAGAGTGTGTGAGDLVAPVVRDLGIDFESTLTGVARIASAGTVTIRDAAGKQVSGTSGTSNPSGGDVRFAVPRAEKGATYTAVLQRGGQTVETTFVAPTSGADAPVEGTVSVDGFDPATGTATVRGTATANVEYRITVRGGTVPGAGPIRSFVEPDGTWSHQVTGLRRGAVVDVLFVRDQTNQKRVTVTV